MKTGKKQIGWKKVHGRKNGVVTRSLLLKLEIRGTVVEPFNTVWLNGGPVRKFRTNLVKVVGIYTKGGKKTECRSGERLRSDWSPSYYYRLNRLHRPTKALNHNPYDDCGSGIHFFKNRKSAAAW